MIDFLTDDVDSFVVLEKLSKNNLNDSFSILIRFACTKAFKVNDNFMACRLVSVDADIEHNPNVLEFYNKNGFLPLKNSVYKKKFPNRTKIVGMWKDIFS